VLVIDDTDNDKIVKRELLLDLVMEVKRARELRE
jgi:hypothetical protein